MGDNATKDFILRYVFGIAAELISSDVELLRALLRLHYGRIQISFTLAERLVQVLREHSGFKAWPLDKIVPDFDAFFAFLQERWPVFLSARCEVRSAGNIVQESETHYAHCTTHFLYPGPKLLPFDHQDILVYLNNLFTEGELKPVQFKPAYSTPRTSYFSFGIVPASVDDDEMRVSHLFELVEKNLPTEESRYSDWTAFALKWAELSSLVHCGGNAAHQSRLKNVGDALNATFAGWLSDHYSSLINLSPTNPVMLHHVPRRLARDVEGSAGDGRTALIVVDGLALDQWVTVRQLLKKQDNNLVMRESATFAWVPTLTSISRQSIFSGKPPLYFPSSINSTNSEEKLWKQFWEGHGISRLDIAYQRGLGDGDASSVLDAAIHPGKTRVVGLVVDKVDKIMHGMQLGAAGMHNQIKQWCEKGFLCALVGNLLDYGYEVWLTADHGNIECIWCWPTIRRRDR